MRADVTPTVMMKYGSSSGSDSSVVRDGRHNAPVSGEFENSTSSSSSVGDRSMLFEDDNDDHNASENRKKGAALVFTAK